MENENDLPGDDGVEVDDTDDLANNAADDDDAGGSKKAAKGGAAKKKEKSYPKAKPRKSIKKKPDDMPRRPLSAYNYFFSEMRTKLLADRAGGGDELYRDFMSSEGMTDVSKKNGFFANMGKFVAKKWKSLQGTDEMKIYTGRAEKDLARYRKEMDEYREGVARKTRLASEEKLRDHDVEVAVSQAIASNADVPDVAAPAAAAAASASTTNQPAGWPAAASAWLVPGQAGGVAAAVGGAPFMQGVADPQLQMLLHQQAVMAAQNPQLNAFLLQQQFAAAGGGMPGFAPQFAQIYGQQQQQQPQQQAMMMMMMGGGGAGFPVMAQQNPADLFQYNFGGGGGPMYAQQVALPQLAQSGEIAGIMAQAEHQQQQDGQFMAQQQQAPQGGQDLGNDSLF